MIEVTHHRDWFLHSHGLTHLGTLQSLWTPVFTLLVIWAGCLLIRYGVILYDRFFVRGSETPEERAPLISEYEGVTRERESELVTRFSKSASAARTLLLMILTATIFLTVPVFYMCQKGQQHDEPNSDHSDDEDTTPPGTSPYPGHPGQSPHPIIPDTCGTCVSSLADDTSVILSYVFLGLSIISIVMEYFTLNARSSALSRAILGFLSYPLILGLFAVGFNKWNHLKNISNQCGV